MNDFIKDGFEVEICEHGMRRLEERAGVSELLEKEELAWKVLQFGRRSEDCKGCLSDCIEHYARAWHKEKDRQLYYYKEMIYVFQANCLVTLFPVEERVRKAVIKKQERKKIAKFVYVKNVIAK